MIIITVNNGKLKFKYEGKIDMEFTDESFKIQAQSSKDGWDKNVIDYFWRNEIKLIESK